MTEIKTIAQAISDHGGTAFLVGGCVRDQFFGLESKDIDIEVYGLDVDVLASILANFGKVDSVGKSFGVLKLTTSENDYDFSLPRTETKSGVGHRDFVVETNSQLDTQTAAARRDFTMNAIMQNALTGEIVDHFGGVSDVNNRVLNHTSPAFFEDPLRVLRAMQFIARFQMEVSLELEDACFEMRNEFVHLPKERIWTEFEKLFQKGIDVGRALYFIMCVWGKNFPEILALSGCPQNPVHHPEGDVLRHTMYVLDAAAKIACRENITGDARSIFMLAALCHDFGKPMTTTPELASPGHDKAGAAPTSSFLDRIGCPQKLRMSVVKLVEEHMFHTAFPKGSPVTKRSVRRLINRLAGFTDLRTLVLLTEADKSGRPPLPQGTPEIALQFLNVFEELGEVTKIEPIVRGRDLMELGVQPGPQMGTILKTLFEAQLDGEFESLEDGINFVKKLL